MTFNSSDSSCAHSFPLKTEDGRFIYMSTYILFPSSKITCQQSKQIEIILFYSFFYSLSNKQYYLLVFKNIICWFSRMKIKLLLLRVCIAYLKWIHTYIQKIYLQSKNKSFRTGSDFAGPSCSCPRNTFTPLLDKKNLSKCT